MQITVRLLASYRRFLPEGHDEQAGYLEEVTEGATLAALLADLPIPAADAYAVLLNGRHAEQAQVLQEGDVVAVFPAAGGGQ